MTDRMKVGDGEGTLVATYTVVWRSDGATVSEKNVPVEERVMESGATEFVAWDGAYGRNGKSPFNAVLRLAESREWALLDVRRGDRLPDDPATDGTDRAHPAYMRGRESMREEARELHRTMQADIGGLNKVIDDLHREVNLRRDDIDTSQRLRGIAEMDARNVRQQRDNLERDLAARTFDLDKARHELARLAPKVAPR